MHYGCLGFKKFRLRDPNLRKITRNLTYVTWCFLRDSIGLTPSLIIKTRGADGAPPSVRPSVHLPKVLAEDLVLGLAVDATEINAA